MATDEFSQEMVQTPTSMLEVEELVKRLYLPGSPALIVQIQETLQKLQRSPEGWILADKLLESNDEKVRFFGALTFTVKLNADWDSLSEHDVQPLLARLISWLVRLVSRNESALVVRKLCSTLVAFFLRPSVSWTRCLRHLVCSISAGDAILEDALDQYPPTPELLQRLSLQQIVAILWFSSTLAEEAGKVNIGGQQQHSLHQNLTPSIEDVVVLLGYAIAPTADITLKQEGVKCLQSWLYFAHRAWVDQDNSAPLHTIRTLVEPAMHCLLNEDLFDITIEVFIDTLSNFSIFFRPEDMDALSSLLGTEWAGNRFQRLRESDFEFESLQFGRFLLAFGDATVDDLVKKSEEQSTRHILGMLHGLLQCEGYPIVEDEICEDALEFWNNFVDSMSAALFAEEEKSRPWMGAARQNVIQAIEECWGKVRFPPSEVLITWDSDSRKKFQDFRRDVNDLLQSAYTFLGAEVFERLVHLARHSLEEGAWENLEATLFCLNALAECISDDGGPEDDVLVQLLGSSMFSQLSNPDIPVPPKARQTAVNMLGHYSSLCKRHTELLPSALNFLFTTLSSPALSTPASKSISLLCSSCRKSLTSELETFLEQYGRFLAWPSADISTKEKVIGAIAAIIQALPSEEAKAAPTSRLLQFVEADVQSCLNSLANGQTEEAQGSGVAALRCLSSMGKLFQAPDDLPLDLDSETPQSTFWDAGAGKEIQNHIVKLVDIITGALSQDGEIIEEACNVYRSGLKETTPGPFVFPPSVTVEFILKSNHLTPRVENVLTTACVLLTTHLSDQSIRIDNEARLILLYVLRIVQSIGGPSNEPEIAQSCVDVIMRFIPRYINVLLNLEVQDGLERLFAFILDCLRGDDILPKRSAASFWAAFVSQTDQPEPLQSSINNIMAHMGPLLAVTLVRSIAGGAPRSDLDALAEPLKKLVFKQPRAKTWLEGALYGDAFPSDKVDQKERRIWLQKVMSLRGSRNTNQLVRELWIASRGTNFAYAS
ncbi:ARM repeat-containing protein [Xylona heveae TC161]|uniref:ARM repeat-containing protein n=1 Tax=Xylona heveae (strain CBS 132557 / TC161) TaxID=1328760 RepID=A0A164ZK14_XYLHT|nr:ARM repeat-containing protein [Xylona heveae TC161]KZF19191.1 ARM repeat-containing protein [Xylona heveae TC161]